MKAAGRKLKTIGFRVLAFGLSWFAGAGGSVLAQSAAGALPPIACVGDSLTAPSRNWVSYTKTLSVLTGRRVINLGVGGQTSKQIIARQGGNPARLTIRGAVLPSSGTVRVDAHSVDLLTDEGPQYLDGWAGRTAGRLNRLTNQSYTFTRMPPGSPVAVPRDIHFMPKLGWEHRTDTQIIWVGRNDDKTMLLTDTKKEIAAAVAFLRHNRFIIMGITTRGTNSEAKGGQDYESILRFNSEMSKVYGKHFFDVRKYLIEHSQDEASRRADRISPSLMYRDLLHLNSAAHMLIAQRVAAILASNDW